MDEVLQIMINQTLDKRLQLRLFGMHDAFKTSLKKQMTQDQFIFHLVSSEWDNRANRDIERAIKTAMFRYNATLEDINAFFRGHVIRFFDLIERVGHNDILENDVYKKCIREALAK